VDEQLVAEVVDRLAGADALGDTAADFVLAALHGSEALTARLDGTTLPPPAPDGERSGPTAGAYLRTITVAGFRGVGPAATLALEPGPGLTLIVGRNGSGKSSFAEGLEVLLTGENRRWSDRSSVWRDGWRNLHVPEPCAVEAELAVDGQHGVTTARRTWATGAEITDGDATVQASGAQVQPLSELHWAADLVTFRPFLSYNELGSMLDEGPSKLFDALASILGLEQLVATEKHLRDARLERDRLHKAARDEARGLVQLLADSEDQRARACANALEASEWDLATIEGIVSGSTGADAAGESATFDALLRVAGPDLDAVTRAAAALRDAAAARAAVVGTDSERSRQEALLLGGALAFHGAHGDGHCPVCRAGALDAAWRKEAEATVARLREEAEHAERAHGAAAAEAEQARALLGPPPPVLDRVAATGLDASELAAAWAAWDDAPEGDDLELLAGHLERSAPPLVAALDALQGAARAHRQEQEDRWRPQAEALRSWLPKALVVQADAPVIPDLKAAEEWVKAVAAEIRQARFAPLAGEAQEIWTLLRQQSSVSLDGVRLEGTANRRRVALDVTVDGVAGAALGVMSQGELHALALSLFLPRATMDESPFRFLVIDDPVQSMDPARVDGLALALQRTAADRQVVVFTHDDRLPDAARRLGVEARVIEVTRRAGSVVETRVALDPVTRAIADAHALVSTRDLPEPVSRAVIPGLCRQALEARFAELARRRRLAAGDRHVEVEARLAQVDSLTGRAALALFDDRERGGDVYGWLNRRLGRWAADAVRACARGAHGVYDGDLRVLVRDTERLVTELPDP
jgi:energy-coupling factor transporter ATP-binding protein EcfA2